MAKTLNIDIDREEDRLKLFGINSILKDYQMSALINQVSGSDLRLRAYEGVFEDYSIYFNHSEASMMVLLQNLNLQHKYAFEKLKSFEYILLVSGGDDLELINKLNQESDIIYLSEIEIARLLKKEEKLLKQLLA